MSSGLYDHMRAMPRPVAYIVLVRFFHGVRLYAVFGYNLLVISAIVAIGVLLAPAHWRRGARDRPSRAQRQCAGGPG
jgi:hypothetical protein